MTNADTPIRVTPLHSSSERMTARLTEQQGWEIAEAYSTVDAELGAARNAVAMADATRNGKLTVEGTRAQDLLSTTFDLRVIPINAGIVVSGVGVYRLRNDLFFVSTVPGEEESIQRRLEATALQSGDFVTITDITHGRSELRIVGPKSRQLLSKVCGLDFRPSQFPDQTAKQSSVAKTAQLIIRRDIGTVPAFAMIGARSFGEYLWDTLRDAGREFDLTPIGRNALHTLREQQEQQRSGS